MCGKYYEVKRNILILEGGRANFKYDIDSVLCVNNIFIVLLAKPIGEKMNENIFGVDKTGEKIWQIEKTNHVYMQSPYMNIYIENNQLWAGNWDGNAYKIDSYTGKILDRKFTK